MAVETHPERSSAGSPEPLGANLCWLLSQAGHALTTELTAALAELGVAPRGYCVLTTAMQGERTQIELADAVGLDKTTMVVTIDQLEAAGLVRRVASSADRRARVITVTGAGRRKAAAAEAVVQRIQEDVLAALPARERKVFLEALAGLVGDRLARPVACARPVRRRAERAPGER